MYLHTILLVGAGDEVVPPGQVPWTCQHTVASIQQQLGQADQRILNEEMQGVLQLQAHQGQQPATLGKLPHVPGKPIHIVPALANSSQFGMDDVDYCGKPCLPKKQACLQRKKNIS